MPITLDKRQLHDTHCMIQGISWAQFENIELAFSGVAGVRFIYLDGILEIMTLSPEHEDIKSTIGLLLESYLRQVGSRLYKRGNATLGSKSLGGRKEPDESYNLIVKKSIPDLVIEVILTSGSINLLDFIFINGLVFLKSGIGKMVICRYIIYLQASKITRFQSKVDFSLISI